MITERTSLTALSADIGVALTTTDDLYEMLNRCTEALVRHLDAAFARIWELDTATQVLVLRASSGLYTHLNGPHGRVRVGQFKIGLIAQEREPHLTNDVLHDPRVSSPEWARREGMASFAGYPLLIQNEVMGVMALFSRNPLSDETLHAMGVIASGIALGIKRKQEQTSLRDLNRHLEKLVVERTQELRKTEAELYQSRKMEAIGRLAGGVAHDFNNLLTGILGCSESLEEMVVDPEHRTEIAEIRKATERAATLTRQLLAFSRQQILSMQPVQVNHRITETSQLLQRLMGEDIHLDLKLDPTLAPVRADPGQLDQVVMNIVLNGRDAMPTGGRLRIETSSMVVEPDFILSDISPGAYIMMTISDTGTGMSPEVQARIFEPFFTTKAPGKGTGLGLATAQGIVKQMGGNILIYSHAGLGSTFKILLPEMSAGEAPRESAVAGKPSESTATGGTETILLVEDEALVARHVARLLSRKGYTVLAATRPSEALTFFAAHPEIALVLTDVVMPEMSGKELVAKLHAERPDLKVLFMSGYPQEIISQKGVLDPGIAFIAKPFHSQALCQRIREILDTPSH